jgi:hypothetical protein
MWPFSNNNNAMDESNKYLNQIQPMLQEQYDPYLSAGMDPSAMQNQWMSDFVQSPGQRLAMEQALKQQRGYAAGQGMMGTPSQQLGAGRLAAALQNDQMQQYFNNNRDLFNTGLTATQGYTGDMSNVLGVQGGLAYQNAENKNKGFSDFLEAIGRGAGGAAMGYATGGAPGAVAGGLGAFFGTGGDKNEDVMAKFFDKLGKKNAPAPTYPNSGQPVHDLGYYSPLMRY